VAGGRLTAMGAASLAVITRALSPAVIATWLVLSIGLVLLNSRQKSSSDRREPRIVAPVMLAFLLVLVAIVWHQITGDFIPVSSGWPAAVVMGFAMALALQIFVRASGRAPLALSAIALLVHTPISTLGFGLVFFVLPAIVRWEFELLGI